MEDRFDQHCSDSQATAVQPVAPEEFDLDRYAAYEDSLLPRCRQFRAGDSGVLVYRRMRVAKVFSHGCRDMKASLAWQLGALQKGMGYRADVPNFLEPWYGIGTVAAAFGIDYVWPPGQAPAVRPRFASVEQALECEPSPVAQTPIGSHTLAMIDYFLERTQGRLPMSLTDTQSPLNVACNVVQMERLFMDMYDRPEQVRRLLERLSELLSAFTQAQVERIGDRLVWPGHGFASCRGFDGIGLSDDNALMISGRQYADLVAPAVERLAGCHNGWAFHSCGRWSDRIESIRTIPGLRMVDAAFSAATDPDPNEPERFAEALAGTGIVVNARIVGDAALVRDTVRRLWTPGMKLIIVTYCTRVDEQARAYDWIHELCA
jgi:hypothetical protein